MFSATLFKLFVVTIVVKSLGSCESVVVNVVTVSDNMLVFVLSRLSQAVLLELDEVIFPHIKVFPLLFIPLEQNPLMTIRS